MNVFYRWINVDIIVGGPQAFLDNYSVGTMNCGVVCGLNTVITVAMYESYNEAYLNVSNIFRFRSYPTLTPLLFIKTPHLLIFQKFPNPPKFWAPVYLALESM